MSFLFRKTSKSLSTIDYNKYLDQLSRRPMLAAIIIMGTLMTIVVVTTFIFIMATTIAIAITGIILIEGIFGIDIAGLPIIICYFYRDDCNSRDNYFLWMSIISLDFNWNVCYCLCCFLLWNLVFSSQFTVYRFTSR